MALQPAPVKGSISDAGLLMLDSSIHMIPGQSGDFILCVDSSRDQAHTQDSE